MSSLKHPGVPYPPPFLFVAAFLAGLALDRWMRPLRLVDGTAIPFALAALGTAAGTAGLALAAWAMLTFAMARTSIVPMSPATMLVGSGPYRFSRNPMYVGLAMLYVGLAIGLNAGWPLLFLPLAFTALYLLVVRREERYLTSAFGAAYLAYQERVRRWL